MVGDVDSGSNAQKAGLQKGDKFVSVNGVPTPFFDELKSQLSLYAGKKIKLVVDRKGEPVWLDAEVTKEGKTGFCC
ncbi:MAG: PDZ domain-containing protein [Saprospirales bacterium]|nr:PDZ domain-containing protein [Saprospirales bacterium]